MTKQKTTGNKIPKLKEKDRIKIIDTPELLVVHPLTHAASIRYGHKSNWCTATSNKEQFKTHIKEGIFIYIIFYEVDKNRKRIAEKSKIAIYKRKRHRALRRLELYDRTDQEFSVELVKLLVTPDHWLMILNYLMVTPKTEGNLQEKMDSSQFNVGDVVKGLGDGKITLRFHECDEQKWQEHVSKMESKKPSYRKGKTNKWYKFRNFSTFYAELKIQKKDILEAEVIKVCKTYIVVKVKKLGDVNLKYNDIIDNFEYDTVKLYMTVKKSIEKIS